MGVSDFAKITGVSLPTLIKNEPNYGDVAYI